MYDEFPVSDVKGYEKYMPYDVQLKIWRAYKTDLTTLDTIIPSRERAEGSMPGAAWSAALIQSEWHGEDAALGFHARGLLDDTRKKSKEVQVPLKSRRSCWIRLRGEGV